MPMRGLLSFVFFWLAALATGTAFVMLVLGGGFGWLLLAATPAVVLLLSVARGRRR
jgi:hypothetical protein